MWYSMVDLMSKPRFKLSQRSLDRLDGVHPDLVRVVKRAIDITEVDFGVTEGMRTQARQRALVASGASQTMNSRHLTGHAVDVVAYEGTEISWQWPLYFQIAEAFRLAAIQEDVRLVWGGAWSRCLNDYKTAREASDAYVDGRRAIGRTPFMDGPHFELYRGKYPA